MRGREWGSLRNDRDSGASWNSISIIVNSNSPRSIVASRRSSVEAAFPWPEPGRQATEAIGPALNSADRLPSVRPGISGGKLYDTEAVSWDGNILAVVVAGECKTQKKKQKYLSH